jgi:hypothetical protein
MKVLTQHVFSDYICRSRYVDGERGNAARGGLCRQKERAGGAHRFFAWACARSRTAVCPMEFFLAV